MTEPNWALARKCQNLQARARILQRIRAFFVEQGYLEVETPLRVPTNAPEAHIDAEVSGDWFLHTSPELAMKRMLAAGYEQLFQLCRCWRQGERGERHLPEFTMLEWYRAGADYRVLMSECTELLRSLVPEGSISWQGEMIDLTGTWPQLTVKQAFEEFASASLDEAIATDRFEELLTGEVEPQLGRQRPTFLTEYPTCMAALARKKPDDPSVAERFELYIAGMEMANAFSELTDPVEQRNRFEHDEADRRAAGKPPYPIAEKFLADLTTMPDAAGIALGIDRLVMLLTDSRDIGQVVTFTPDEL
jgi:lysyl-tRNA synthetase class 2